MAGLEGKKVLLGISGGIAVYKVAELARLLVKSGAQVKVVMTDSAQKFVTALTFRTLTGNPVATTMWADPSSPYPHISLSEEADIIVVAPATANIIAKMANGIADDLLSTTLLAARGTVLVAPAMNTRMYLHPATVSNLARIREMGAVVVDACEGDLACGDEGAGRMAEPAEILATTEREVERSSLLAGRTVLITGGPTREYIDPVRFISNPSTGLMSHAVARAAVRRGARVVLISGPTGLTPPHGVDVVDVVSAAEMRDAVLERLRGSDVLVMAAAVADYRPARPSSSKMKKSEGVPALELEPTEDILKEVSGKKGSCLLVGFAAETDDVLENARKKLGEKGLDLIVANKVGEPGSGFGTQTDLAAIIKRGGGEQALELMTKTELADRLLDEVVGLLALGG
ncbi:MAG: bifunctional phosphopantothenoylcysteine decarboxylase/phosphopantothenate--cysteine ligase CoaBC [Actinomycetota bacterium]